MRRSAYLLLCGLLAACGNGNGAAPAAINGSPVALLEYVTTAPAAWSARQPSSEMRLAEFTLPATAGQEAGEVVVFFFGAGQGGSVEANAERWQGQFTDDRGEHPQPTITHEQNTAFTTTLVELRGSYARNIGMGANAAGAKPDQVLLAAVVETPKGNLHIQMHGPAADVLAQRAAFLAFVRGIRPHTPVT
jgi:hypothetical protein